MIAHVDGTVSGVAPDGAVIDVGGVGLLVQCTPGTLARLRTGERAKVATSLVVREDALTLYGFASEDERNTFELLQTASGVGPRLALAMLAVFTPDGLRRAVATEDLAALTTVPGIGRKGAQRIVLELAGRLGPAGEPSGPAGHPGNGALAEVAGSGTRKSSIACAYIIAYHSCIKRASSDEIRQRAGKPHRLRGDGEDDDAVQGRVGGVGRHVRFRGERGVGAGAAGSARALEDAERVR